MKMTKTVDMGRDPVSKVLWSLAIPSVITMFAHTVFHIVDTMFIAWLGTVPLAGMSLMLPVIFVEYALMSGCTIGATTLISRNLGMGRLHRGRYLANATLSLVFLLSLLPCALLVPSVKTLFFSYMGASPEALVHIDKYLFWQVWSFPVAAWTLVLDAVYRSQGNATVPMFALLIGNLANILLDPLLMFTFGMAIGGASLATLIGRSLTLIYSVAKLRQYSQIKPKFNITRNTIPTWRSVITIGLPLSLSQISFSVGAALLNRMLAKYGEAAISGWTLGNRIEDLAFLFVFGFNTALVPFVAYNLGRGAYDRVKEGFIFTAKWSFILMSAVGIVLYLFPYVFLAVFKPEELTLAYSTASIRASTTAYPVIALTIVIGGLFQGAGHTHYNLFTQVIRNILVRYPLAVLLNSIFGINGIWWCQPVSSGFAFLVSLYFLKKLKPELFGTG
ncbi:MAG TPA: MATE family efflux transporter [Acetomicrobium flavidum]|uniref:MATE family efflux transporter n=1 Tax=Acetomicrobium flavidum TaxID=49896 RepID=UPI002C186839|nr:MATE family efflux transporter [Acetomicrobium flavidum]